MGDTMNLVVEQLMKATRPEEVFGSLDGASNSQEAQMERLYRQLARSVHPDLNGDQEGQTQAFQRLTELFRQGKLRIEEGRYGAPGVTTITTSSATIVLNEEAGQGEICQLYSGQTEEAGGRRREAFIKVARAPMDNDLVDNEIATLRLIHEGDPRYHPYFPSLIEGFTITDGEGVRRKGVALERAQGFFSLAAVRSLVPEGLPGRQVGWIMRRLLVALGYLNRAGIVHGAVVPEHILIHPKLHGLVLVDYSYAFTLEERPQVISAAYSDWYPPEVEAGGSVDSSLDLYLAASVLRFLLGKLRLTAGEATAFAAFEKGCQLTKPSRRPHDGWELKEEFDELLERLYGPKSYVELILPEGDRARR
jgi:hypothetical protein